MSYVRNKPREPEGFATRRTQVATLHPSVLQRCVYVSVAYRTLQVRELRPTFSLSLEG